METHLQLIIKRKLHRQADNCELRVFARLQVNEIDSRIAMGLALLITYNWIDLAIISVFIRRTFSS